VAGGLRSVVAATAQPAGTWRGVACNAFGRQAERTTQPPFDDNPAKELQATPLQRIVKAENDAAVPRLGRSLALPSLA
jgi:hypothetical protein